jgi:CRISPR-associated protein Cmr6
MTGPGRLPLYGDLPSLETAPGANLGLLFEKFFTGWNARGGNWVVGAPEKAEWLEEVALTAKKSAPTIHAHLAERQGRMEELVRARGGRMGRFVAVDRLVAGTGRPHPVENGFGFHHLLGVPYLPGSSLKGVARAWAKERARADETEGADVDALFGSEGHVGACDVLDALPVEPPRLVVEVLTPHYGGWTPEDPPGDWRSPVPVPYLALEAEAAFLVAVVARRGSDEGSLESVWKVLVEALRCEGVGARTALGFGRLELVEELHGSTPTHPGTPAASAGATGAEAGTEEVESPAGRWRRALRGMGDQQVYERVREMAFSGAAEQDELDALVAALEELGYLDAWRDGRRRGTETTGAKKLRELAARLEMLREGGSDGERG